MESELSKTGDGHAETVPGLQGGGAKQRWCAPHVTKLQAELRNAIEWFPQEEEKNMGLGEI